MRSSKELVAAYVDPRIGGDTVSGPDGVPAGSADRVRIAELEFAQKEDAELQGKLERALKTANSALWSAYNRDDRNKFNNSDVVVLAAAVLSKMK